MSKPASLERIETILGDQAKALLTHTCKTVSKERLHLPGPDSWIASLRNPIDPCPCCVACKPSSAWTLGRDGLRLGLPVDQGIEHSAGASFAPNPDYFDPKTS